MLFRTRNQRLGFIFITIIVSTMLVFGIGQFKKNQIENYSIEKAAMFTGILSEKMHMGEIPSPLIKQENEGLLQEVTLLRKHFGVERFKLWSSNGEVIYSEKSDLIGKKFELSEDFLEALEGRTIVEFSHLEKEENFLEKEKQILVEAYVPIQVNKKIAVIAEYYFDVTPFEKYMAKNEIFLKGLVILISVLLLSLIFFYTRAANNKIVQSEKKALLANHQLALLVDSIININSSLKLDDIVENICTSALRNVNVKSVGIFMTEGNKKLHLKVHTSEIQLETPIFHEDFLEGWLTDPKPLIIHNQDEQFIQSLDYRDMVGDGDILLCPITFNQEVYGAITFEKGTGKFSHGDQALFDTLAKQIAIGFRNAKMFDQVSTLSVTDEITGVFNHRYFQTSLSEKLNHCSWITKPLSLMIIDIDFFKKVNDQFGHPSGDKVLKEVASILKENIRNQDIIARYGGEEFGVILENCSTSSALIIAERIRTAIEQVVFRGCTDQIIGRVTVSIGLATFPLQAENKQQLIQRADEALYQAKENGRNQTQVFLAS